MADNMSNANQCDQSITKYGWVVSLNFILEILKTLTENKAKKQDDGKSQVKVIKVRIRTIKGRNLFDWLFV